MDLILFTRKGCQLCERIEDFLACYCPEALVIDVDSHREHQKQYGQRVPVLHLNGVDILEGNFSERALLSALQGKVRSLREGSNG